MMNRPERPPDEKETASQCDPRGGNSGDESSTPAKYDQLSPSSTPDDEWRLAVLDAMFFDPLVSACDFRIAFGVIWAMGERGGNFAILDDGWLITYAGTSVQLRRTRKQLTELGWWDVEKRGRGVYRYELDGRAYLNPENMNWERASYGRSIASLDRGD